MYDAYWDLTANRRLDMQRRATDLFFRERLYKDREKGLWDSKGRGAYLKEWDDWFRAAGMDFNREMQMAGNWASELFGGKASFVMPDRDTMDRIGMAIRAPNVKFVNSRAAMTMRQATLSAMHNSVWTLRGALGNEASMLHR